MRLFNRMVKQRGIFVTFRNLSSVTRFSTPEAPCYINYDRITPNKVLAAYNGYTMIILLYTRM